MQKYKQLKNDIIRTLQVEKLELEDQLQDLQQNNETDAMSDRKTYGIPMPMSEYL